ncbi:MAG: ATP phosphoribosyltransferase regulatory subunit [Mariprofundaceae bacterium]|nr:ATP phosphoribosyltransferase regulatory subunit [Mariprofundaceae bacterium]
MSVVKPILGLEDAFGSRAKALRLLQFRLFELYSDAGFSEVIPPLVERPAALNSGAGSFLSDQTVVFSDPADAGLLAIRPDMTPQIARLVATRMSHEKVLKLHYSGPVMLARPDVRSGSRQQWQTGVECLGLAGEEGDVEVMHLAALSMAEAGFKQAVLQVGHMGLIQALVAESTQALEAWVNLIARHSPEDMATHLASESLADANNAALMVLAAGQADAAWLAAEQHHINADFAQAAQELLHLAQTVSSRLSGEVEIVIDVAVTPRFLYHSGMVFTGFAAATSHALLHGGRYDTMMATHGRDMPATGFSFDLWAWLDNAPC